MKTNIKTYLKILLFFLIINVIFKNIIKELININDFINKINKIILYLRITYC